MKRSYNFIGRYVNMAVGLWRKFFGTPKKAWEARELSASDKEAGVRFSIRVNDPKKFMDSLRRKGEAAKLIRFLTADSRPDRRN